MARCSVQVEFIMVAERFNSPRRGLGNADWPGGTYKIIGYELYM
jgi:hypothetical protein